MRKPKIKNLSLDLKETRRVRSALAKRKGVKITINIDSDSLEELQNGNFDKTTADQH